MCTSGCSQAAPNVCNQSQLHWYGSDHTNCDPFRSLFNAASAEKEDMMCLNDRLADLFGKLDKVRQNAGSGKFDNSAYLNAINCLQEEVKKLKCFYESELSKLRRDMEKITAEKNECVTCFEKCKNCADMLQHRNDDLTKENIKLSEEMAELKTYIGAKEREVSELACCLQTCKCELELLRPRAAKYEQDSENFRKEWECERRYRQETEDKNLQLNDKLNFDCRMHEQHVRDLLDRLDNATSIIEALNAKLKELDKEKDSTNLGAMLQKIREQMMQEFGKYKRDTEEAVNKALTEMKDRLDQRAKEHEDLENERDRLITLISKMQGQANELEGQLTSAIQGNFQLQEALKTEKLHFARCVRDLEIKLVAAQDSVMQKVREVAAAREVQTSLQAEIESYKIILECEERKLKCPPAVTQGGTAAKNPMYQTQGFPNHNPCSAAPPPCGSSKPVLSCRPKISNVPVTQMNCVPRQTKRIC